MDLKNITVTQSPPPDPAEELEEAKAWGFDTAAEFYAALDEAQREAEARDRMEYMIHRFAIEEIFGDSEEYEEHSNLHSCVRRVKWLASCNDGFEYWAEDADGNVYNADTVLARS